MNKKRNILICPLEWGLGHAARMIPIARILRDMNCNVIIGAGEEHLALFRAELPGLTYIKFSGFRPGYSRHFPQYLVLLLKTPLLLYNIFLEHIRLKKIIDQYSIDIVISDNRFGLWNRKVVSVYVTHLPRIPLPESFRIFELMGIAMHRAVIKKYTLCFIPDLPGELNISGRLSHGLRLPDNVRYTGILSRFIHTEKNMSDNSREFRHNTIILSGPEPQRGMLKDRLVALLQDEEPPTVVLEGRPGKREDVVLSGNIISYNHLNTPEMRRIIEGSESIISRSGYTTIMDLISLNRSALLIPTPGQTEQEYLAEMLSEKGWFFSITQKEIKPGLRLPQVKAQWSSEIVTQSKILLSAALKELLEKDHKKGQPGETGKKTKPDLPGVV